MRRGGLEPEVDDGRAVGDVVVADDDDDLGLGERRERQPERVERVGGRLGQHRGVRAEPAAQEPGERVGLLERLGAGERGDDAGAGAAEQLLGAVERGVPGDRLEPELPARERLGDAVVGA